MTERITLIRESRPLARTPHICTCCLGTIAIGSKYACVVVRDNERTDRNKNLLTFRWHLPLCPREMQS